MNINTEIEFKLLTTKDCINTLCSSFNDVITIDQTNHYFTSKTENLLSKNIAIRIREIANEYTFTLKHKEKNITEYECIVESFDNEIFKNPDVLQILNKFDIKHDLINQGSLRTIRKLKQTINYKYSD